MNFCTFLFSIQVLLFIQLLTRYSAQIGIADGRDVDQMCLIQGMPIVRIRHTTQGDTFLPHPIQVIVVGMGPAECIRVPILVTRLKRLGMDRKWGATPPTKRIRCRQAGRILSIVIHYHTIVPHYQTFGGIVRRRSTLRPQPNCATRHHEHQQHTRHRSNPLRQTVTPGHLGWWQEGRPEENNRGFVLIIIGDGRTKENSSGSGISSNIIGNSIQDIIGNSIRDGLVSVGSLLLFLEKIHGCSYS